jgi:hypothetical protein
VHSDLYLIKTENKRDLRELKCSKRKVRFKCKCLILTLNFPIHDNSKKTNHWYLLMQKHVTSKHFIQIREVDEYQVGIEENMPGISLVTRCMLSTEIKKIFN